jgi:hypothetical protein
MDASQDQNTPKEDQSLELGMECSRKSGHSLCCELVYMRVS